MAFLMCLVLVLGMAARSSASYCVCKDGIGDAALQKVLDYACGNGADCQSIQPNGACYSPSTLKSHCDYAANSYYQKKAGSGATCQFGGAATLTQATPVGASSTCSYGATSPGTGTPTTSPSTGANGTTSPSTGAPIGGNPSTGTPTAGSPTTGTPASGTPVTGTPITGGTGGAGTPTTGTGIGTGTGTPTTGTTGTPTLTPSTSTPFGLAPTGGTGINTDGSGAGLHGNPSWFASLGVAVFVSGGLVLPSVWWV